MNRFKTAAKCAATLLVASCAACAFAQAGSEAPAEMVRKECSRLNYPEAAIRAGAQGVSVVAFHVDENGDVTSADIVQSAGRSREHRLLDQETVRVLSACKFTPAKDAAGHPVASVVTVPYTWRLQ